MVLKGDDRSASSKFIMRLVGILLLTKNLGQNQTPPATFCVGCDCEVKLFVNSGLGRHTSI